MSLEIGWIMAIVCGLILVFIIIPAGIIMIRMVYRRYLIVLFDQIELVDVTERPEP